MDLSAIISNFYSRAGYVFLNNGKTGSITFIGTVSPAGGNLKEPVTESTRKAARCFYGLNQGRADSKRYPAIDPIDSYSKYLEYPEVQENLARNVGEGWLGDVLKAKDILLRGKEAMEQINILGDDGVPITFHETFWKSELIDFVILQQDAFDKIDASTPMIRQKYMLSKVLGVAENKFKFNHFEDVSIFFKEVINKFKQMNYSDFESDKFKQHEEGLEELLMKRVN
jgi:V/A-type H+/Na+-transporting ATPase subunit A